jgi:hypothetical protein
MKVIKISYFTAHYWFLQLHSAPMFIIKIPDLRSLITVVLFSVLCVPCFGRAGGEKPRFALEESVYEVVRLKKPMPIDGDWNKSQWKKAAPLVIENYMGKVPAFKPGVEARMMYDDENIYVIFRVQDQYVRSRVREYNGNVSGDACVEFFFAPDNALPMEYFNLEVNAGGTPLIFYVTKPWTGFNKLSADDIKQIEIAHSLPARIDPEITEPVTWTLEYRVPLSMLRKFSNIAQPKPGTRWRANFYKTASETSNPHWITWSQVDNPQPNFHLPQFFGTLIFK